MVVSVEGLSKSFGGLSVIEGLSFSLQRGEVVCLLGPSGSGKSTLLNIMAGLLFPDGGFCRVEGSVSYVFQESRLLPWRSVLENVLFVRQDRDVSRAEAILGKLGLLEFSDFLPDRLSGGMKQRVAIARAFYAGGELLLMDEPFQALDIELRIRLIRELISLWEVSRNTIFFVTHSVEEAILLGHRILVFSNRPSKIKREYRVEAALSGRVLEDFKDLKREIELQFVLE